jgi:hypothetical protein
MRKSDEMDGDDEHDADAAAGNCDNELEANGDDSGAFRAEGVDHGLNAVDNNDLGNILLWCLQVFFFFFFFHTTLVLNIKV